MQNKKTKQKQTNKNKVKTTTKIVYRDRPTPYTSAGGKIGQMIGKYLPLPMGESIGLKAGRFLGAGIGSIFGSGDYTMVGQQPGYNVLCNGKQIPKFSTTSSTNIVCHREYLGDITGTTGFNNQPYPLNPGVAQTFPWLSTIAQGYQEYKFHGIIFEFRSLVTDFVTSGAPGVIVMSTNYNADVPAYTSKQAMENAEFAVSVKPTENLMHAVECATKETILAQRYVRTGSVPSNQDLRLYDYGNFQFATQGNPTQDIGELWVSYCVEFFKPILPTTTGGSVESAHVCRSGVTAANPLGLIQLINVGSLAVSCTGTTISFYAYPQALYDVTLFWSGSSAAVAFNAPSISGGNMVKQVVFNNDSTSDAYAPLPVASSQNGNTKDIFRCTLTNPGLVTLTVNNTGVFPTTTVVDVFVNLIDSSITA